MTKKGYFYSINHDVLTTIFKILDDILGKKSELSIDVNNGDLSLLFNQIGNDFGKLLQYYIPDVLYKKVPETVEKFLNSLHNLEAKSQLIPKFREKDFFIETINLSIDGLNILKEKFYNKLSSNTIKINKILKNKGIAKLLELNKSDYDKVIFNNIF